MNKLNQLLVPVLSVVTLFSQAEPLNFKQIDAHFINPPNDFRLIHYYQPGGVPKTEQMEDKIDEMVSYGIGGIQTRVPLRGYLQSKAGWQATDIFIKRAKTQDFQIWIHDEAGYPSGSAKGLVVEGHPEYEARGLIRISKTGSGTDTVTMKLPSGLKFIRANISKIIDGEIDLITTVQVPISDSANSDKKISTKGLLGKWQLSAFAEKILDKDTQAQSTQRQFKHTGHYPSLLNKDATARFIELTHQGYADNIEDFQEQVDVFYTGEANLMASYWNQDGSRAEHPYIPWEKSIIEAFQTMHGYDVMAKLDALFSGQTDQDKTLRLHYYQTIAKLVAENYAGQITDWSEANGVRSMGHPLLEEELIAHVFNYGDMLGYLRKFHITGCDLHIAREDNKHWVYWMGKYISSAAYLDDRDGTTIMGLLDPIIGHGRDDMTPSIPILKRTVNMNMLVGLNQFTSYMPYGKFFDGYSRREYRHFNEYVGRITMMLRGSRSEAPIAMYYPIKTFQSKYLATDLHRNMVFRQYQDLQKVIDQSAKSILENGLDFNFVTDDVLLTSRVKDGKLHIGSHNYSQLLMPVSEVLPLNVLQKIQKIAAAGIPVHWLNALPNMGTAMEEHQAVRDIAKTLTTASQVLAKLKTISKNEFSVQFESSNKELYMTRYRKEDKRIYYVVNDSNKRITLKGSSDSVKSLKIYNPVDGMRKKVSLPHTETIGAYESLLFVEDVESIETIDKNIKNIKIKE